MVEQRSPKPHMGVQFSQCLSYQFLGRWYPPIFSKTVTQLRESVPPNLTDFAPVVELEYTSGLSPDAERIEGSNPSRSIKGGNMYKVTIVLTDISSGLEIKQTYKPINDVIMMNEIVQLKGTDGSSTVIPLSSLKRITISRTK